MALWEFLQKASARVLGTRSERWIRRHWPLVAAINAREPSFAALSDQDLREKTVEFRRRLADARRGGQGLEEALDALMPEAFAAVREAARRTLKQRPYDVQLLGGMALHEHKIAEMLTGEGKTLVATLPAYLNALPEVDEETGDHRGVHIVTVNDYLARRDAEWMGPVYRALGVSCGYIQSQMPFEERLRAYLANVTYGTASEFGFDYLRDHLADSALRQVQRVHAFALIDEVDSILIDEARTPLIISGQAEDTGYDYGLADSVAAQLDPFDTLELLDGFTLRCSTEFQREWGYHQVKNDSQFAPGGVVIPRAALSGEPKRPDEDADTLGVKTRHGVEVVGLVEAESETAITLKPQSARIPEAALRTMTARECTVDVELQHCHLDEAGMAKAEQALGLASGALYEDEDLIWPHLITQALKARHLYLRDVNYVVENGRIVIVNEFTGRKMPSRRWSNGLHQAVEAKEGVPIQEEDRVTATITIQNFFRLYRKRAGMTGTAKTEEAEFQNFYNLEVIEIPPNKPCVRDDMPDVLFGTALDKQQHIVEAILERHDQGQPVLVGTTSVEKSEKLFHALTGARAELMGRIEVLNARHHAQEAQIVARAGRLGAITIATNMAGRGTDIVLGGVPEENLRDRVEMFGLLHLAAKSVEAPWKMRAPPRDDRRRFLVTQALATLCTQRTHRAEAVWRTVWLAARLKTPDAAAVLERLQTEYQALLRFFGEARTIEQTRQVINAVATRRPSVEGAPAAVLKLIERLQDAARIVQAKPEFIGDEAFRFWMAGLAVLTIQVRGEGDRALLAMIETMDSGFERLLPLFKHLEDAATPVALGKALAAFAPPDEAALRAEVEAEQPARARAVVAAGGLCVIGTERHEARRVDNQLKGRSGRQGDPGRSRFYLSLEDDLMRLYMSDNLRKFMMNHGFERGMALESRLLTRSFEKAQERVEQSHYESRRRLLAYDGVMDTQRRQVYEMRRRIIEADDLDRLIDQIALTTVRKRVEHGFLPEVLRETRDDDENAPTEAHTRFRDLARWWQALTGQELSLSQWRAREHVDGDLLTEELSRTLCERIAQTRRDLDMRRPTHLRALLETVIAQARENAQRFAPENAEAEMTRLVGEALERHFGVFEGAAGIADRGLGDNDEELPSAIRRRHGEEIDPQTHGEEIDPQRTQKTQKQEQGILSSATSAASVDRGSEIPQSAICNPQSAIVPSPVPHSVALVDVLLPLVEARTRAARELMALPRSRRREHFASVIDEALSGCAPGEIPDDERRQALFARLDRDFALRLDPDIAAGWNAAALRERGVQFCDRALLSAPREFALALSPLSAHFRQVALSIIDHAWTDHLTELENLRQHVRMESYAQKDPRDVFRKAGKELYDAMIQSVFERILEALLKAP